MTRLTDDEAQAVVATLDKHELLARLVMVAVDRSGLLPSDLWERPVYVSGHRHVTWRYKPTLGWLSIHPDRNRDGGPYTITGAFGGSDSEAPYEPQAEGHNPVETLRTALDACGWTGRDSCDPNHPRSLSGCAMSDLIEEVTP